MPHATALTVAALLTVLLGSAAAEDASRSVVGLWLGEARTRGGLGSWIEFRADGTAELGFGALIGGGLDETYRLEETTLRVRAFSGKTTSAGQPVFESLQKDLRIEGDRAIVESQMPKDAPTRRLCPRTSGRCSIACASL